MLSQEAVYNRIMTAITFLGIGFGFVALIYHLNNCDREPSNLKYVTTDKLLDGQTNQHNRNKADDIA